MSWKSLVCASLICALASPVFAAPSLSVTHVGVVGGERLWTVSASPDPTMFGPTEIGNGGSLALELGFRTVGGNFLDIVPNPDPIPNAATGSAAAPVEFENPGNRIWGWEPETVSTPAGMFPQGILIGTGGNANQAFAALGTTIFQTEGPHELLTIATQETVTELEVGGRFNADGSLAAMGDLNFARVAQGLGTPGSAQNFQIDPFSVLAIPDFISGDFSGSGSVGIADLNLVLDFWGDPVPPSPPGWIGDQPEPPSVGILELNKVLDNWGATAGGGAALATAAVPEPSSFVLAGLALVAVGLLRRRGG